MRPIYRFLPYTENTSNITKILQIQRKHVKFTENSSNIIKNTSNITKTLQI